MATALKIGFSSFSTPEKGVLIVFAGADVAFGPATRAMLSPAADLIARAAAADGFKGRSGTALTLIAPQGLEASRLIVVGTAKDAQAGAGADSKAVTKAAATKAAATKARGKSGNGADETEDMVKLGGAVFGRAPVTAAEVAIMAEFPGGPLSADQAADLALGAALRAYSFDIYKTRTKDDASAPKHRRLTVGAASLEKARTAYKPREAVADGVLLARDLVNEPANVLYPEEFARRAAALRKLGVDVDILDKKALTKLKMNALLGVGQGSVRESRVVVMRWNGGKKGAKPLAFVGKGVCFDTGGISIKPAAGMEDMKGDMAGAACVVGLMHTLAARKAKVNAVGAIGLVENMPDGNAQRPGDIVTSMSGQTIEIINTDAEGRLVLADVLWYVGKTYKPEFMVDLATLTGAIIVSLGHEYAGLFANDDALAGKLVEAGTLTGERVWRMPLGPEYDKQIDSKFADMKNTGGRMGGAITAAQFLQRFVEKTPWAHLDIAGTGMGSPQSDINKSWGSGFGVRLLDRLVAQSYEK